MESSSEEASTHINSKFKGISDSTSLGIYTEFIGFLIVFGCGLVLGLILSPFGNSLGFPTFQMADRGTAVGLIFGAAIAFPSGIGVALSVTGMEV